MIKALAEIRYRWRPLGLALGLSPATLEQIGHGPAEEALSTMVCKWMAMNYNIEKFPKPSWDALAKAVADPAGAANRKVAEEIAKSHPSEDGML